MVVEFEVGGKVLVRLQPYRQSTVVVRNNKKLSPLYYGPFEIIARNGIVTYELKLPDSSMIHPVFHVSSLKPFRGNIPHSTELPLLDQDAQQPQPMAIWIHGFAKDAASC